MREKEPRPKFILKARGLTCEPIVVSSLLNTPEMTELKNQGRMVGDREVIRILFEKMLEPQFRDGAVLDGFPRTAVQVQAMKWLVEKINALHREYAHTPLAIHFRKPIIHVMVLFVTERVSVARQLQRGHMIEVHNAEVAESGEGEMQELRLTDLSEEAARRRYRTFKEVTWDALQSLKELFFYHFINAEGSIKEVERNISAELKYQSSLELEEETFDLLRTIPLASEITRHARQELVRRLDMYQLEHENLLKNVIGLVSQNYMPIIKRHAISGMAVINSENTIFEDSLALKMLIDVFSERGYHAVIDIHRNEIPERVDLVTGEIRCREKKIWRIRVNFKGSEIRRG